MELWESLNSVDVEGPHVKANTDDDLQMLFNQDLF